MKMNLRLKAILILPISPLYIMGALLVEHWDDVVDFYEDIFKAMLGIHELQKRAKRERAKK